MGIWHTTTTYGLYGPTLENAGSFLRTNGCINSSTYILWDTPQKKKKKGTAWSIFVRSFPPSSVYKESQVRLLNDCDLGPDVCDSLFPTIKVSRSTTLSHTYQSL
jgi:hypothetical protein